MNKIKSMYIHIPFCNSICSYCDFCKILYNEETVKKYLNSLSNEIKDRYNNDYLDTLYIGGGTPSCFKNDDLNKLFEILKNIKLNKIYEYTFECNINDINEELLKILKENKVNRLSIGIESFDKENLKLMNRYHDYKEVKQKIILCRSFGFNNINLDLMYALPNEKMKTLKKDLRLLLNLKPEHISTYSLIMNKHTKIFIEGYKTISDEIDYEMYKYIQKKLKRRSYFHYELSNFAKNDFEAKHNLCYWNNSEYYGFGLSSSGYIDGIRYKNTSNMTKYINEDYDDEKEILSKEDKMTYELIMGLRKIKGIDVNLFKEKYNEDILNVFPLKKEIKNKNIIYKKNRVFINPKRLYLMNEILIKLI